MLVRREPGQGRIQGEGAPPPTQARKEISIEIPASETKICHLAYVMHIKNTPLERFTPLIRIFAENWSSDFLTQQ